MNTTAMCKGACCRNPFGVCHHSYECDHHKEDQAQEQARQAIRSLEDDLRRAASRGSRQVWTP